MTVPLICTSNTWCHTDYGIPISVYKSTDYRTATRTYHRLIPPAPQDFDCRVKARINPDLLRSEPTLKDETYKTLYNAEYTTKQGDGNPSAYVPRPIPYENVDYLRIVQEKMFKDPPPPLKPGLSEMKESYCRKNIEYNRQEVFPPIPYALCEVKALGRDEQPPIRPEKSGYYRYMDPYMTTSRLSYIPYTKDQQDGIARKDIITFYDAAEIPKGGKGFGPKNGPAVEPIFKTQIGHMHDKLLFKIKGLNKLIPKNWKRIPNFGMQSEYQGKYTLHTHSDFYPYLRTPVEDFEDSLANAGAWQNLAAPGMYCTEYCHIGTGWPVRSIIDPHKPKEIKQRDIDLCRNPELLENQECMG